MNAFTNYMDLRNFQKDTSTAFLLVLMVLLLLLLLWLILLLGMAIFLWCLVATGAQQLRWWWRCWYLDDNVSGLTYDLRLEALLGIGCVLDGAYEAIRIDHRVAALDHRTIANFLAILIVGELIVFHIKAELIRGVLL